MNSLDVPITIEIDCKELGNKNDVANQIRAAVVASALSQGFSQGSIGVLITDDETIHQINRDHLSHDYPTDVISFAYSQHLPTVEGELVASLDTARREATELSWATLNELLLYVVHGSLHICGLEDTTDEQKERMRSAEQKVLRALGIADAARFSPSHKSISDFPGPVDTHSDFNEAC